MSYRDTVNRHAADPAELEQLYQTALHSGEADSFTQAIAESHAGAPENLLFAAWYYRLQQGAARAQTVVVAWGWLLPLALANGLLFWLLSDFDRFMVRGQPFGNDSSHELMPLILLFGAPLAALFVISYMAAAGRRSWLRGLLFSLLPLAAGAYVMWVSPRIGSRPYQEQYVTLMALHLPLLAWVAVGAALSGDRKEPVNRFAFLIKSLEVIIMGGLFAIAGGLFTLISFGLFDALSVDIPVLVQRLFIAGGGGLIPVLAAAVIYNPRLAPADQPFDEGLSKLVALLMRLLLPLTLIVLLVYLAFIPFNFREPFDNREVLIIYNGMLFAVIALLVGATPVSAATLAPRLSAWLRRAIVAVAVLAFIISIYALAAIVTRTYYDRLTPNRLTFIGWNIINIVLLLLILIGQLRAGQARWRPAIYRTFKTGTLLYAGWTLVVILALPLLFSGSRRNLDQLPQTVQQIVYENADPILLKCADSPHIYLLDSGEKRWIDTIDTFEGRGYVWRDVRTLSCDDLRIIPDGAPIPEGAGPPPQP